MTEKQTDDIEQIYRPPYRSLTVRGLIIIKEAIYGSFLPKLVL